MEHCVAHLSRHRSLPCSFNVSDAATGGTTDYSYHKAGITYSYTPELRGGSFNPDPNQIEPAWTEFWAASIAMIEAIEQLHVQPPGDEPNSNTRSGAPRTCDTKPTRLYCDITLMYHGVLTIYSIVMRLG